MLPYSYDPAQLRAKFLDLVMADKPHKWYDHTVKYAHRMKSYCTGEGQEEHLIDYKRKEDNKQIKQRIRLTNTRTQFITHKVDNSLSELENVDPANKEITYGKETKNDSWVEEIKKRLSCFHDGKSLQNYAFHRVKDLNRLDPNAFIVVEQNNINDELRNFSYPLEIYSDEAWQYEKKHGILQFLIARVYEEVEVYKTDIASFLAKEYELIEAEKAAMALGCKAPVNATKNKAKRSVYTLYGPNVIYRLTELFKGDQVDERSELLNLKVGTKSKAYALRTYETNNPYNPAFPVGYLRDSCSKGETYVSIFHGADKLFKQLIWEVSELHLAKALHGFIQKYVYAPACSHSRVYSECGCDKQTCTTCYKNGHKVRKTQKETCNGGRYNMTQEKCTVCKGTGKNYHVTSQDIVVIKAPETKDQQAVPLADMVHYVELPVHIIEGYQESIRELERDIYKAALNFDLGSKEDVKLNETATGRILDMRGLYAVLGKLGEAVSCFYKHAVRVQAGYLGYQEGLIVEHAYPLDLRLETIDDKITQRKSALDAGLPTESIRKIDESIMVLQCNGSNDTLQIYRAWENWRPLSSKSVTERLSVLAMYDDDHPLKVLDTWFDQIRCEITEELEGTSMPFCMMKWSDQKRIIDEKVAAYTEQYFGEADTDPPPPDTPEE